MITFPSAKVNLGLNVLRRRPDGYHDISTVMYAVDWCDILEIVPAKGNESTLTATGNAIACPPEKNLVMKALRAMQARYSVPESDIFLHKIIPDGAGLGGGSADAARVITTINELYELSLSKDEMAEVAATIGCDCPFFVYGGQPMTSEGRGEVLRPIDGLREKLHDYWFLIVKPQGVSVPTAQAYAGITPSVPTQLPADIVRMLPVKEWRYALVNDFEKSIFAAHPRLDEMKSEMYRLGAVYAAMSGSGSAIFGIFANDDKNIEMPELFRDCYIHGKYVKAD